MQQAVPNLSGTFPARTQDLRKTTEQPLFLRYLPTGGTLEPLTWAGERRSGPTSSGCGRKSSERGGFVSGDRSLRRRARRSYLTARRNGVAGRRTDGQAGVASAALAEQRQDFPWENLQSEFADSQGWRARGPRPLHPLRTPVQGGPAVAAMVLVRVEGRTAPLSATSAWTQPRTPSSACVATSSVGRVYISGWRPDLTDKCVQFAKPASAEIRSSRSMAGAALASRTPERRPLPVLKDRGQSQRTEGDFKDLDLEMVASRCLLELGHFLLGYLPQHLTLMMGGLLQLSLEHPSMWMSSSCHASSCLWP